MTESQVALYGGAWWLGPLFLAAQILLYWYLTNAPFTARGRQRAEERSRRVREQAARERAFWQDLRERQAQIAVARVQRDGRSSDEPGPSRPRRAVREGRRSMR
jgi:hypothetical protein